MDDVRALVFYQLSLRDYRSLAVCSKVWLKAGREALPKRSFCFLGSNYPTLSLRTLTLDKEVCSMRFLLREAPCETAFNNTLHSSEGSIGRCCGCSVIEPHLYRQTATKQLLSQVLKRELSSPADVFNDKTGCDLLRALCSNVIAEKDVYNTNISIMAVALKSGKTRLGFVHHRKKKYTRDGYRYTLLMMVDYPPRLQDIVNVCRRERERILNKAKSEGR